MMKIRSINLSFIHRLGVGLIGGCLILFIHLPANAAIISHSGTGDCNGSNAVGVQFDDFIPCDDRSQNSGNAIFSDTTVYAMSLEYDFPTDLPIRIGELSSGVENQTADAWVQFDVRFSSVNPFSIALEASVEPSSGETVEFVGSPGCGGPASSVTCNASSVPLISGLESILYRLEFNPAIATSAANEFHLGAKFTPSTAGTQSFSMVMLPRTTRVVPGPTTIALVLLGLAGFRVFHHKEGAVVKE